MISIYELNYYTVAVNERQGVGWDNTSKMFTYGRRDKKNASPSLDGGRIFDNDNEYVGFSAKL